MWYAGSLPALCSSIKRDEHQKGWADEIHMSNTILPHVSVQQQSLWVKGFKFFSLRSKSCLNSDALGPRFIQTCWSSMRARQLFGRQSGSTTLQYSKFDFFRKSFTSNNTIDTRLFEITVSLHGLDFHFAAEQRKCPPWNFSLFFRGKPYPHYSCLRKAIEERQRESKPSPPNAYLRPPSYWKTGIARGGNAWHIPRTKGAI